MSTAVDDPVISAIVLRNLKLAESLGALPSSRPTFQVYVERAKRLVLDPWQKDLCNRLERAFWIAQAAKFEFRDIGTGMVYAPNGFGIVAEDFYTRQNKGSHAAIHGPPQHGKSVIISMSYPAWILGYDPTHRFRLATYNENHSEKFSLVIRYLMRSPEHQAMFPDPVGWIHPLSKKRSEWSTNARVAMNDGQSSFSALGLRTGFVGTGFDTLLMDDPYKGIEEALSEVIRDSSWRFYSDTAHPRWEEHANEFIMFHRYHQDDMGGRAIATGYFELWRYAAVDDGPYVDSTTGLTYPCLPLYRAKGERLSPRKSEALYLDLMKNDQMWQSQFQGRPTSLAGGFFNVALLKTTCDSQELRSRIVYWVRAWDNAATEGGGAFSAGVLMGIDSSGAVYVFHVAREQLNTAQRKLLQGSTAENDGVMVPVHGPEDPGSAGRDVAFEFREDLGQFGYNAMTTKVSGSKESRAYNYSKAVNSSTVYLVQCCEAWETCSHATKWDHAIYKDELQHFPVSTYKDQVDASADAYNYLRGVFYRGLVVRNFSSANLLRWDRFSSKFGDKIAGHWEVSGAIRLAKDSSTPSGWVLMARASEDAGIGEVAFVVAASRMYVDNPVPLISGLRAAMLKHCVKGTDAARVVWIRSDGPDVVVLTSVKHGLNLSRFENEATAGLPELNYYFEPLTTPSPFDSQVNASRLQLLVDPLQMEKASDDGGLLPVRQEVVSWAYNEKHEPQPFGGITLDCMRMILYNFALTATALTADQKREAKLREEHRQENVLKKLNTPEFVDAYWAREAELRKMEVQEQLQKRNGGDGFVGRRPLSRGRMR